MSMHLREFEELLPINVRLHAARRLDGDVGWPLKDMEAVILALTESGMAVTCMDVWGISESTPEGLEPFRTSTNPDKYLAPETRTRDGRVVWNMLIDKSGETVQYGFENVRPAEDQAWLDFVQATAEYTLNGVKEVSEEVTPAVADKLYFSLCVAKAPSTNPATPRAE